MSLVLERWVFPRARSPLATVYGRFSRRRLSTEPRSWPRIGSIPSALAGIALLGVVWGSVVAIAELNALLLAAALFGCVFILRDFRVGVVLLILFAADLE